LVGFFEGDVPYLSFPTIPPCWKENEIEGSLAKIGSSRRGGSCLREREQNQDLHWRDLLRRNQDRARIPCSQLKNLSEGSDLKESWRY
jgi:hypothetical protein